MTPCAHTRRRLSLTTLGLILLPLELASLGGLLIFVGSIWGVELVQRAGLVLGLAGTCTLVLWAVLAKTGR